MSIVHSNAGKQGSEVGWVNCYQRLRESIENGKLGPGVKLVERELCKELGVSRPTLRTALHLLGAEGLVELVPHRGASVARLNPDVAMDIFDVREALEGLAAGLAAVRASDEHINKMGKLLLQMRASIQTFDYLGYSRATRAFHEIIMDAAANQYLEAAASAARIRLIQYDWPVLMSGHILDLFKGHEAILEAIKRRDPKQAEASFREHMGVVKRAALKSESAETPDTAGQASSRRGRAARSQASGPLVGLMAGSREGESHKKGER